MSLCLLFCLCCTDTDVNVTLENTEYFVDEDDGFVEMCAVMTTLCSVCPLLNGNITLSVTASSATGTCTYTVYGSSSRTVILVILTLHTTIVDAIGLSTGTCIWA